MIISTLDYKYEWTSTDIALLSEESLKDIWINNIEDEAWKDL